MCVCVFVLVDGHAAVFDLLPKKEHNDISGRGVSTQHITV